MMDLIKILVSGLAISILTGCVFNTADDDTIEPLERPSYITGLITKANLEEKGEAIQKILVEEDTTVNEPTESGGKKIWLRLTGETKIFIRQNDSLSKSIKETLRVDQKVEGWTTGIIAESYPAQAIAKRIIVASPEE